MSAPAVTPPQPLVSTGMFGDISPELLNSVVSLIASSSDLRSKLNELSKKLLLALDKYAHINGNMQFSMEDAKIEKFFKQVQAQVDSQKVSLIKKIFMRIAMIFAIVLTAASMVFTGPAGGVVLGIVVALMVAQLTADFVSDKTGNNFFQDGIVAMCGGNKEIAKWVGIGIEIGMVLASFGAGAVGRAADKAAEKLMTSLMNTFSSAEKGAAKGAATAEESVSLLASIKEFFKTDKGKALQDIFMTGSFLSSVATGFATMSAEEKKLVLAEITNAIALIDAMLEMLQQSLDRQNAEIAQLIKTTPGLDKAIQDALTGLFLAGNATTN